MLKGEFISSHNLDFSGFHPPVSSQDSQHRIVSAHQHKKEPSSPLADLTLSFKKDRPVGMDKSTQVRRMTSNESADPVKQSASSRLSKHTSSKGKDNPSSSDGYKMVLSQSQPPKSTNPYKIMIGDKEIFSPGDEDRLSLTPRKASLSAISDSSPENKPMLTPIINYSHKQKISSGVEEQPSPQHSHHPSKKSHEPTSQQDSPRRPNIPQPKYTSTKTTPKHSDINTVLQRAQLPKQTPVKPKPIPQGPPSPEFSFTKQATKSMAQVPFARSPLIRLEQAGSPSPKNDHQIGRPQSLKHSITLGKQSLSDADNNPSFGILVGDKLPAEWLSDDEPKAKYVESNFSSQLINDLVPLSRDCLLEEPLESSLSIAPEKLRDKVQAKAFKALHELANNHKKSTLSPRSPIGAKQNQSKPRLVRAESAIHLSEQPYNSPRGPLQKSPSQAKNNPDNNVKSPSNNDSPNNQNSKGVHFQSKTSSPKHHKQKPFFPVTRQNSRASQKTIANKPEGQSSRIMDFNDGHGNNMRRVSEANCHSSRSLNIPDPNRQRPKPSTAIYYK